MTNHTVYRKSFLPQIALWLLALLSLAMLGRNASAQDSSWATQTNIYQVFVEKFGGTLKGVESHLDHLEYMGVETIWLMPIFESMSDHGYDTTNYYAIRSEYGTIDDLRDLVLAAEGKGMRVILDLVMNHVGSDHPWFSSANPAERKDHWFVWSAIDQGWNKPWGGVTAVRASTGLPIRRLNSTVTATVIPKMMTTFTPYLHRRCPILISIIRHPGTN